MSSVNVNIKEAAVTAVNKFTTNKGVGADFYIEARSSYCTVYLQVVLYDTEATRALSSICEGDTVTVTGVLKDKPYSKKDGTAGHSLLVERPTVFVKIACGNRGLQQSPENYDSKMIPTESCAVNAAAVSAYDSSDDDDFMDRVIFGEFEKEMNESSSVDDEIPF